MYYGVLKNGEIIVSEKCTKGDIIVFNTEDRMEANMFALEANIYSKLTKQYLINSSERVITKI